MIATLYNDIREALTTHLEGMADLPEVAWENMPYTPTTHVPYLAPSVMWAEPTQAEFGTNGMNHERGIYQIACVYPEGQGTEQLNLMMGKLKVRFKRGTTLQANGLTVIVRKCYANANGVVSIPFYCLAEN